MSIRGYTFFFVIIVIAVYMGKRPDVTTGVPVVEAPCGKVSGVRSATRDGREMFSYKGIPYAKPPVGILRFARTQPWEEEQMEQRSVLATKFGNNCIQMLSLGPFSKITGSEDCLYVNVYVPKMGKRKVRRA
jgi:carboxylesterase type B